MKVNSKPKAQVKPSAKPAVKPAAKKTTGKPKAEEKPANAAKSSAAEARPATTTAVKRKPPSQQAERKRAASSRRAARNTQFNFMKEPNAAHIFQVGDTVEVFCDHDKNRERIRGWVKGIVVQVDQKLAAVQFRSNVYLTDGWMVPDRILWFPVNSEHIRPLAGKKPAEKKQFIPDY